MRNKYLRVKESIAKMNEWERESLISNSDIDFEKEELKKTIRIVQDQLKSIKTEKNHSVESLLKQNKDLIQQNSEIMKSKNIF